MTDCTDDIRELSDDEAEEMLKYDNEGWWNCPHCGLNYYQHRFGDVPKCRICKDHPYMVRIVRKYKYYYRERPAGSSNPTHFDILVTDADKNSCCLGQFPIEITDLWMARRFCEVMNDKETHDADQN